MQSILDTHPLRAPTWYPDGLFSRRRARVLSSATSLAAWP
jgi:hypothetical protein